MPKPISWTDRQRLEELAEELKSNNSLEAAREIYRNYLDKAIELFESEPILVNVYGKHAIFIGDVHGDIYTFKKILKEYPVEDYKYILLGDYVDRSKTSTELLAMLLAEKIIHGDRFVMLRGNHECPVNTIAPQEFPSEFKDKLDEGNMIDRIYGELFAEMPIAAIYDDKYFCVHGGIPIDAPSISDIKRLEKVANPDENAEIKQLIWNDPLRGGELGYTASKRGAGIYLFGQDIAFDFLSRNGFEMMIRGHEHGLGGHKFDYNGKMLTIATTNTYSKKDNPCIAKLEVGGQVEVYDMSGMESEKIE